MQQREQSHLGFFCVLFFSLLPLPTPFSLRYLCIEVLLHHRYPGALEAPSLPFLPVSPPAVAELLR